MFTGIIEAVGEVKRVEKNAKNVDFSICSPFARELKINQSVAHDGCCLSVVQVFEDSYEVTAVHETLIKTNLSQWAPGVKVNLERSMLANGRLDGHIVQGHVDQTASLVSIEYLEGSYMLGFEYVEKSLSPIVDRGSIAVNGISLTVCRRMKGYFSVSIIPYTWRNTNLHRLELRDRVNLEFDIVGKYISSIIEKRGRG